MTAPSAWITRRTVGRPSQDDCLNFRCLSTADLGCLQSGYRITVTWGGGNGPHEYTSYRDMQNGVLYAVTDDQPDELDFAKILWSLDAFLLRPERSPRHRGRPFAAPGVWVDLTEAPLATTWAHIQTLTEGQLRELIYNRDTPRWHFNVNLPYHRMISQHLATLRKVVT